MALLTIVFALDGPQAGEVPDDTVPGPRQEDDGDGDSTPAPGLPSTESWVGAETTRNVWSIYSGLTWAPLGSVREDGWRVRLASGYGRYRYRTPIGGESTQVYGQSSFADLLAGYHATLGALTLKAFVGGNFDGHLLLPFDPGNSVSGMMIGFKAALEGWYEIDRQHWAALDVSWSGAHRGYFSRLRIGHRLTPELSVGLEGGAYGNQASNNGRGGAFLRYEWESGEIAASGGLSGDIARPTTPYATLVYLSRF